MKDVCSYCQTEVDADKKGNLLPHSIANKTGMPNCIGAGSLGEESATLYQEDLDSLDLEDQFDALMSPEEWEDKFDWHGMPF